MAIGQKRRDIMRQIGGIGQRGPGSASPPRTANSIVTLPDERLRERRPTLSTDGGIPSPDGVGRTVNDDREMEEAILVLARKRFQTALAAESSLRAEMLEDLRFRAGEQWPDQIKADRTNDKRPLITINRIPQFVKQITNPQRQSRPSIQINPVGDGADPDTAEILQGIIRHIEHTSHAEVAYDEAYEDAVVMGRGFFRILTGYPHDGTFDQEIYVQRVSNPFAVYFDPASQELDYSDARFAFVVEDVPMDEYELLYPGAERASLELFQGVGDRQPDWFPEGKVRVAEYWFVEEVEKTIALIDGWRGKPITVPLERVPKGTKPHRTRLVKERRIHWVKMNAAQILDHKIWPGHWIPIVPVLGDEIDINGQKNLVGIVRYARDPQRMYNYWVSAETETIALAPKTPFIGAEGQFKGHEAEWKTANTKNHAYLEYVNVDLSGKPAPAPARQQFEPPIRAIVEATKQADNDLKAVIGFYDASLGAPGPDQSGRAILARQKQGETANVNFIDNLGRALWHAGRIYIDLIPKVYDAPRAVHIMRGDDSRSEVWINEPTMHQGIEKIFDVRVGRYNVTLSIGPSYQSKRQEAVASMLQLVQGAPQMIPLIGDLLVGEMDWPVARQIAARLKKTLPPQLQDQDGQEQMPPQAQAQIAQLTQQLQLGQQIVQKVMSLLKSKQLDIDSKERVALMQTHAQVAIAQARFGQADAKQALDQEFQRSTSQVDRIHELILQESDQEHEQALAILDANTKATTQQQDGQQQQSLQTDQQGADAASQDKQQQHEQTLARIKAAAPPPPAAG